MLLPVLRLVSSFQLSFPGGSNTRRIVCYKIVDALYIISLRIGFEMTRENMTHVLQKFFAAFNSIYDGNLEQQNDTKPHQNQGMYSFVLLYFTAFSLFPC